MPVTLASIDRHITRPATEWRSIVIQVPADDAAFRRRRLIAGILRAELAMPAARVRHTRFRRAGHRVYVLVYRGTGTPADRRRFRRWEAAAQDLCALDNPALERRLAASAPRKDLP